jgi:hypothetical protein
MADNRARQVWLRTDEIEEFIDALEHTAKLAGQVRDDLKVWKWLIIALHSALQGAMLTDKSWKAVWHWLDVDSRKEPCPPKPDEKLASLRVLFARVRDSSILPAPDTLIASPKVVADIDMLNRLRNDFIHFVPHGLSLELSGMPRIVGSVTDAIEHLAITHPTFWHHLRQTHRNRIAVALDDLRTRAAVWADKT